ncbi:hypothetical protein CG424_23585 [Shigella boydii]|nr:hypothetical protein CG424_23585 [Shigella boydii]
MSQGKRHNQALIALARRRCDVLFAMMRDGTFIPRRGHNMLDNLIGPPPSIYTYLFALFSHWRSHAVDPVHPLLPAGRTCPRGIHTRRYNHNDNGLND